MSRLPSLSPELLAPELQEDHAALARLRRHSATARSDVYRALGEERSATIEGPASALLFSPGLAPRVTDLGLHLRNGSSLPVALMELVILSVAAHWRCAYAWDNHAGYALRAGISEAVIATLRDGRSPVLPEGQALALRYARSLLDRRSIDDGLHREVLARFRERGVVELAALVGYYGLLCSVLTAFDVPARGDRRPFAATTSR
ncbi:MAG: hypothetical protein FJX65_09960 [Alphaproteobacteria bacterium]|nr:hypothetical protein [Alphaproteobacteria bacterium]